MSNDNNRDDDEKHDRTVIITEKVDVSERSTSYEPYLIQISGRETGQMHNLSGRLVKIGRDATCQIVLEDPHVSRFHAEIFSKNGNDLAIKDSGSTNGVFVNGRRVTEQVLLDGDKILIGTRLYFKFCFQDAVDQNYQQNLFRAANIDNLTQLYNKKYFIDALSKEFSFSRRNSLPLSLIMIDIDFFKSINDTHGHIAGDLVLKALGQSLIRNLRMENIAARYGGEEFSVILRNATGPQALLVAERLRTQIAQEQIVFKEKPIPVTVSIGIATFDGKNFETIEDFIHTADANLYEAKETGRNCTILKQAA